VATHHRSGGFVAARLDAQNGQCAQKGTVFDRLGSDL
jgi:hypothetical protein